MMNWKRFARERSWPKFKVDLQSRHIPGGTDKPRKPSARNADFRAEV
jgi:hypothetical protein